MLPGGQHQTVLRQIVKNACNETKDRTGELDAENRVAGLASDIGDRGNTGGEADRGPRCPID